MNSSVYKSLMEELNKGKKAVMVTIMDNTDGDEYSAPNKILLTAENLQLSKDNEFLNKNMIPYNRVDAINYLDSTIYQKAQEALEFGNLQFVQNADKKSYLMEPYFPEPRLIIFGGGHIAKPLAEFGAKLGFLVTVVDDRPIFANKERFPDAEKVICESFENSFKYLNLNEAAFVVIVTRGHRHDLDCLKLVLKCKTAYTGMIGSRRRVKSVKEQLLCEGYSEEQINKVYAPIGLEIGAVTPEEIAISIIAQVVSQRRQGRITTEKTATAKVNWPELDRVVVEELCKEKDEPRAIITIIATKGSVPRKAGAKMLVWPYGKTLGSIGGGCSEGEVIQIARDVIKSGGYKLQDIDMTGQIAEEEGMACGGIMEVTIELYNG